MTGKSKRKKLPSSKIQTVGKIAKGAGTLIQGVGSIVEAIGGNHPQWYEAYPLDGLVAVNFGEREKAGYTIPWANYNLRSPTDCKIPLDLTIPTTKGKDAFRESHQIIMNKLRAATGSNVTYNIDDLIAYTLNAREMLALYTIIRRTILATRIVDIYDADAPYKYAMMSCSGDAITPSLTFNSLIANLATDTVRLNRLGMVLASLVPIRMNIMARTAWLFSNIFADSQTKKFSTKMFTLPTTAFYEVQTDGSITATRQSVQDITPSAMLDILENNINAFSNQLQNSRIAGDYLKAFGAFFTQFQGIDESTRIVPIYDEAALTQIQNATLTGGPVISKYTTAHAPEAQAQIQLGTDPSASPWIDHSIVTARAIVQQYTATNNDCIVNTYKDSVTPGEVLSLSRLVALTSKDASDWAIITTGGQHYLYLKMQAIGTESARNVMYLSTSSTTAQTFFQMASPLMRFTESGDVLMRTNSSFYWSLRDVTETAEMWGMDDWAPRYVLIARTASGSDNVIDQRALWDYSNWGKLSMENLSTYHQVAAMSLLATPDMIKEQSNFQFI